MARRTAQGGLVESCAPFDPLGPYLTGLVRYVDCEARAIGELGYLSWTQSGTIGLILGSLVTILVALFGYRLVLGRSASLHDLVSIAVRIGLAVVLVSQWPAYRTLAFDVVMDGPERIATQIMGEGATSASLLLRAQNSYAAMDRLAHPDTGGQRQANVQAQAGGPSLRWISSEDQEKMDWSASVFLIAALAGFLAVRVAAALLLALGPLFVVCLLFDALRGVFLGWAKMLGASALASVSISAVLLVELSVVERQLRALEAALLSGQNVAMLAGEIMATTWLFSFMLIAGLMIVFLAVGHLAMPTWGAAQTERMRRLFNHSALDSPLRATASNQGERSRASALADAVTLMESREERAISVTQRRSDAVNVGRTDGGSGATMPSGQRNEALGQSWRRTGVRNTLSTKRREARS